MKDFLKYYVEKNKNSSLNLIPEMATATVLIAAAAVIIFSALWLLGNYPVFPIIAIMSALTWYWAKAFKDYKTSKEKQDE